jgi:predicted enzyme related to lactoylglutathione lyase/uncharacterized protein YndB with AHSA1/START domain
MTSVQHAPAPSAAEAAIRSVNPLISLPATDIDRAFRFYTETLGMRVALENHTVGFHVFDTGIVGGTRIGIHRHNGPVPPVDAQGVWFWLAVDDIAATRERLESAGVQFLGITVPLGPGLQQLFLDSEGNVLRLWEPLHDVQRGIDIGAAPSAVFAALVDASAIERWFAGIDDVELNPVVGGVIRFIDPAFGRVEGRVTALEPNRRIAFEFSANWPAHLEIRVTETGSGARVDVHQWGFEGIRDREYGIPGLVARVDQALGGLASTVTQA